MGMITDQDGQTEIHTIVTATSIITTNHDVGKHLKPDKVFNFKDPRKRQTFQVGQTRFSDRKRFVNILLGATPMCALVDTGADICIMKQESFEVWSLDNLNPTRLLPIPPGNRFVGANGNSLNVTGTAILPITVGSKTLDLNVYIATDITHNFMLGLDFLQDQQCRLCYDAQTLSIGDCSIPLLSKPFLPNQTDICLTEDLIVPGHTEVRVSCKVWHVPNEDNVPGMPVFIERIENFTEKFDILSANCVTTCKNASIRLANLTDENVQLTNGVRIASATPVSAMGNINRVIPGTCVILGNSNSSSNCTCCKQFTSTAKAESLSVERRTVLKRSTPTGTPSLKVSLSETRSPPNKQIRCGACLKTILKLFH
ncbi:uncharacterized protein LOC144748353 [Ciona intestinalis]